MTFLDSSIKSDDRDRLIGIYNLIRRDHPGNTKRGAVCDNYKESLVVNSINITSLT